MEGLRITIEEKLLSMDRVIHRYPEMMGFMKYHNFLTSTKPRGLYVPIWVRNFCSAYSSLITYGKKSESKLKSVYYVVVRGKNVQCDSHAIMLF